jgi:RNA polymerase sigma-70 factor, ECF subfamily
MAFNTLQPPRISGVGPECSWPPKGAPVDRPAFSDERLMALALAGDEPAFQSLVRRLGSSILTLTTRMLGSDAAGEDVFVDVVATLWLKRHTYHSGRPVRPWALGIAANACRERLRKERRASLFLRSLHARGALGQTTIAPDHNLSGDEHAAQVGAALARLPIKQREVLVLRLWGDLAYGHIAEALGVTEGTVRSNMHHALAGMRRMLGDLQESNMPRSEDQGDPAAHRPRSAEQ